MTSVWLEMEVAPLILVMNPLDQHVDEGGRISVTCTAKQVREDIQFIVALEHIQFIASERSFFEKYKENLTRGRRQ